MSNPATTPMPPTPRLVDTHCHTELAYCGTTISAAEAIDRSRRMNLAGLYLVEHAPQLYCTADDFWAARHVREPQVWRAGDATRMNQFRSLVEPLRSDFVGVGLEVELDADGRLTLHDQDRQWVDLLVGAVHWIAEDWKTLTTAQMTHAFMRTTEGLLASGVHILAHPWRWFLKKCDIPTELFIPLADLLAATGVAAEINFHINEPQAAFFARCIERGVKIAVGSDAHAIEEAGDFHAHLRLLQDIAGTSDVQGLLLFSAKGIGGSAAQARTKD